MKATRTLTEDLLILLLHPQKGRLMTQGNALGQVLAVAALTDLWLAGILTLVEGKVHLKSLRYAGEPLRDFMIRRIQRAGRLYGFRRWAGRFAMKGDLLLRMSLQRLKWQGVIYEREQLFLNLFPCRRYYLIRPPLREAMIGRLDQVVSEDAPPSLREVILLQLLTSVNADRVLLRERTARRAFRKRLKGFLNDPAETEENRRWLEMVKKTAGSSVALT